MKRRRAPFPRAVAAAHEVLELRGIRLPDEIDLEAILDDFWITSRRAPISNAEGRLVRSGRRGVITIDEGCFDSEKWRFVMAHELGHFILHALRRDLACFPKKGATREEKSTRFLDEEAASGFAATLLLPEAMVRRHYDVDANPLERARLLASVFRVSPPTAALRTLDFTDEPCAVVYAERGAVAWCTATKAFGVQVRDGARVEVRAGEGPEECLGHAWGSAAGGVGRVFAQSVSLAPFDASVTMLWHDAT